MYCRLSEGVSSRFLINNKKNIYHGIKTIRGIRLNNAEKNIYEHIMDGDKSHWELTLRSGGMTMYDTYMTLLNLIDKGLIERKNNKFTLKALIIN